MNPPRWKTKNRGEAHLPKEALQRITDFKAYLASKGIVLGADQSAKTKTSLEYFSARLKEEGRAS